MWRREDMTALLRSTNARFPRRPVKMEIRRCFGG